MIGDLASADLEKPVVESFLRRLQELSEPGDHADTNGATSPTPLNLRSSFPLSVAQQEQVREAIQKRFHTTEEVHFETDPDLLLGINLTAGDQKIGWNADSYLASFQASLDALDKEKLKGART